jgi:hypothetical protein
VRDGLLNGFRLRPNLKFRSYLFRGLRYGGLRLRSFHGLGICSGGLGIYSRGCYRRNLDRRFRHLSGLCLSLLCFPLWRRRGQREGSAEEAYEMLGLAARCLVLTMQFQRGFRQPESLLHGLGIL